MDNKYMTMIEAVQYASTLLSRGEIWQDNAGNKWDDSNLLDTASLDETETDDYTYFCVGYDGQIGLTRDNGFNVEWLYKVIPATIIGNRLIELNMTQQALADASGVNIRQIQKILAREIDLANITLKNAVAIARALNIPVEDLLNG